MDLTKSDLQAVAEKLNIEGFSEMRRADLVAAIRGVELNQPVSSGVRKASPGHDLLARVLAVVSIAVSLTSVAYTAQQTKILQRDLQIKEQQFTAETTAHWGELRQTMLEILTSAPMGVDDLADLQLEDKVKWLQTQENLLNSQIDNPVLIGDELSLGYWRNAIASAHTAGMVLELVGSPEADDLFVASAGTIIKDVAFVWNRLVLESDQISATGGHPEVPAPSD